VVEKNVIGFEDCDDDFDVIEPVIIEEENDEIE